MGIFSAGDEKTNQVRRRRGRAEGEFDEKKTVSSLLPATVNGGVFGECGGYVDTSKPPGHSSDEQMMVDTFLEPANVLRLRFFLGGPNLVWFLCALVLHLLFPYEIGAFQRRGLHRADADSTVPTTSTSRSADTNHTVVFLGFDLGFIGEHPPNTSGGAAGAPPNNLPVAPILRLFILNYIFAFSFYWFWFASLYPLPHVSKMYVMVSSKPYFSVFNKCTYGIICPKRMQEAKRKYIPDSYPTLGNMVHDIWFWSGAMVVWTFFEVLAMRMWATGVVEWRTDTELATQLWSGTDLLNVLHNLIWVFLVPFARNVQFWFAHYGVREFYILSYVRITVWG